MLPRNGFFKNIQCPYDKANLCHRPYCHYRHAVSGNAEGKNAVSSSYLYEATSNLLDRTEPEYSSVVIGGKPDAGYVPTPVHKPAGILKASSSCADKLSTVTIPVYNPTPISKLRELNIPHGQFERDSYSPEYVGPVRKKKNTEEYDPTEIKCISKKSVSFADEAGGGLVACEPSFSSDDEYDLTNAAKFSDDDFEDSYQPELPPPPQLLKSVKSTDNLPCGKSEEDESDIEEKKIDEFSLVDKILTETKRNEKLLTFRKKEVVQSKELPQPPKPPLILKGAKTKETANLLKKAKIISNNDIYSMEDDSQSSIPDYSAFDSIVPPIEIDSLIKSKYNKKTFDSDISIYNPQLEEENKISNISLDADESVPNDNSYENSSKVIADKSKIKNTDKLKNDNADEKLNRKKNKVSVKNSKIDENKLKNSSKSTKTETIKSSSVKVKESHKKSSEKTKDSSKRFDEKLKDSSNKVKEFSKRTSATNKISNKTKGTDKNSVEKTKHKSSDKSSKDKSNFKDKSKVSDSYKKSSSKHLASSSSDVELQDGKVSSSCVEKKDKFGESLNSSKLVNLHTEKLKHNTKKSNSSRKPFKRKSEFSDSESDSEREHSKRQSSMKPKSEHAVSSMDESIEGIDISSKESYSSRKKFSQHVNASNEAVSTTDDDDIQIIHTIGAEKSKLKSSQSSKKQRTNSNVFSMDEDITVSSESDYDPNEECWKIYNETFNEASDDNSLSTEKEDATKRATSVQDLNVLRKKRFAHAAAASLKKPKTFEKRVIKQPINPGLVMHNRYAQLLKAKEEKELMSQGTQGFNAPGKTSNVRIAVSPNNSLLAAINEKKKLSQSLGSDFSPLPPTVSKTLKPTQRVAHIPDMVSKPRPIIPADFGSKVPTNIRQKFLNAFIDEYLKFISSEEEAFDEALEEEKKAYQRSSSKAIYMNVASNALTSLRRKSDLSKTTKSNIVTLNTNKNVGKSVSHEAVLNGPLAQRTSFSIEKKKPPPIPDLKGTALYEYLLTYAMSEEQLKENGFPLVHPTEPGRAVIDGIYANKSRYCNDQFKRTCCRCQKVYYVNVDGDYVRDEECDFHWGRLWKRRIAGTFESRYSCCQGDAESDGCCVSTGHVFEGSETFALKGYVKTLPKTPPPDKYYGIYALDCEMCYTTAGMELTRVTVVGPDTKPVYETFVNPLNKVLDFNTRFSGITEENLKNCRTTLRDVQAVLLCIFNSKTILIGHSLESDFKALKLIHETVIDTSVVFPHKMGLPFKRALRTLMGEKLNKIIQNEVGGHDSQEDAVACMELMLWKIKEDLKGNR